MGASLYTTDILRLAAATGKTGRLSKPHGTAERRSAICGSRVLVDVSLSEDGRIREIGLEARACALGQASAALLAEHAPGRTACELETARDILAAYLEGTRETPGDWPGLEVFAAARDHSARHAAIRLAFEAAADAARQAAP